jgi:uncharacterized protein YjbJ (UPF0337 family)
MAVADEMAGIAHTAGPSARTVVHRRGRLRCLPWHDRHPARSVRGPATHPSDDRRTTMSFTDKAKNKAQDAVGKAKEKVGEAKEKVGDVTDNDDLKRDGQADQAEAAAKQAGEKAKDTAKNVKDTFTKD